MRFLRFVTVILSLFYFLAFTSVAQADHCAGKPAKLCKNGCVWNKKTNKCAATAGHAKGKAKKAAKPTVAPTPAEEPAEANEEEAVETNEEAMEE